MEEKKHSQHHINFESTFAALTNEYHEERRKFYENRFGKKAENGEAVTVYAATKARFKAYNKKRRRIGFFTRLFHWIAACIKQRKKMKGKCWFTAEKKRESYFELFKYYCAPAAEFLEDFEESVWSFVCRFGEDFRDMVLWIIDAVITVLYYIWSIITFIADIIWDFRFWVEARKDILFKIFAASTVAVSIGIVIASTSTAYEYSYYGRVLGITRSKDDVYRTIDILGDRLSLASGSNISLNVERDIEFKKIRGFGLDIDTDEDILTTLTYMKDLQVDAFAICVNGVHTVVLEDEASASRVINDIQNYYAAPKEGVEYTEVKFNEAIGMEQVNVQLGEIWNVSEAERYLLTGSLKDGVNHIVSEGETLEEIAETYEVTASQLSAANNGITEEELQPGMELSLSLAQPLVNLTSVETATYYEDIDYGSQYIGNASLYQGETEIKSAGKKGSNQLVATVVRENGVEISRTIESVQKVVSPVDEVLYRGTKPVPEKIGTGTFINPLRSNYTISSRPGPRWGSIHRGIDLAVPTGTKIYASDGGVVTYSGWNNSFGYYIIINHGGLFETYYAHCSKLLVSAGEQIFQGQNIALSGNTGHSTGPHLHFEVRYNGQYLNPEDYVDL